jgi:hypothetical protein
MIAPEKTKLRGAQLFAKAIKYFIGFVHWVGYFIKN